MISTISLHFQDILGSRRLIESSDFQRGSLIRHALAFTYDPMGRRLTKTFGSKRTRWIWDGSLPLHEWTETVASEAVDPSVPVGYGIDSELRGILQKLHAQTLSPVIPQGPPEPATLERPITWLFEPDTFEPLARLQGDRRESIVCDHLGTPLAMFSNYMFEGWDNIGK